MLKFCGKQLLENRQHCFSHRTTRYPHKSMVSEFGLFHRLLNRLLQHSRRLNCRVYWHYLFLGPIIG